MNAAMLRDRQTVNQAGLSPQEVHCHQYLAMGAITEREKRKELMGSERVGPGTKCERMGLRSDAALADRQSTPKGFGAASPFWIFASSNISHRGMMREAFWRERKHQQLRHFRLWFRLRRVKG
jgi:hypothetical protein